MNKANAIPKDIINKITNNAIPKGISCIISVVVVGIISFSKILSNLVFVSVNCKVWVEVFVTVCVVV